MPRRFQSPPQFAAIAGALLGFIFPFVQPAFAQNGPASIIDNTGKSFGCDFVTGRLTASCVPWFIGHLIVFVFQFISVLFLLNVIYAGYQLTMGSITGDKGKGKDRLQWSIVGLIVSVCSFLLLNMVLTVILGS
ncbi:MAG TPA: hypothetical protein VHA78_03970 [Candidatus Peribacteraceae bacterium]|nr:hypothetical protein [Candidatus Peribacteraceae bacterium]